METVQIRQIARPAEGLEVGGDLADLELPRRPLESIKPRTELDTSVAIVGGGFCGTIALVRLAQLYAETHSPGDRPLEVKWFDAAGRFGRGVPYLEQARSEDNRVFLLNQPASQMSPFSEKPSLYVEWLAEHHPEYGADSFTPRNVYGRFLESLLERTLAEAARAGLTVRVEKIERSVSAFGDAEGGGLELAAGSEKLKSGSAILALGHSRREQFPRFVGLPGYIPDPLDIGELRKLPLDKIERITLIGGGPTTIDALRALEHLGYQGRYQIVSASLALPWAYHPELYSPESFARYSPKLLTPGTVPAGATYRELGKLLRREVELAEAAGFGPGHVYFGIDLAGLVERRKSDGDTAGLREFVKLVGFLRGAITTPENCELLRRLGQEKRLVLFKGRAREESSGYDGSSGEFGLEIEHRSGRSSQARSPVLLNCSAFSKAPAGERILALLGRAGEPGYSESVFVVGPPLAGRSELPRTWGVESFRGEVAAAARNALRASLAAAERRPLV